MSKLKKVVFTFYLCCVLVYAVSKYDEILIHSGVRSVGCGGNFVAVSDTAEGLFYNPAVAGLCNIGELVLAYYLHFTGSTLGQVAVTFPLGVVNFGITGKNFSSAEIDEIHNFSLTGKKVRLDTKLANLATAVRVNKNLSFGIAGKYIYQVLSECTNSDWLYDFGMLFTTNDELFSLGYSLTDYTSDNKFTPTKHNAGMRLKFDLPSQEARINILATAEVDYYFSSDPIYRFAIEHWGSNVLGIRIGYIYNAKERNLDIFDQFSFFTAGISLRIGNFGIDYAYLPNSLLGTTHNVGVNLKFMSRKKQQKIKETFLPCELIVEPQFFSPNDDGYLDNIFFRHNITTYTKLTEIQYTITDTNNTTVFVFRSTYVSTVLDSFYAYDGKDSSGNTLSDGEYYVELLVRDKAKNAMIVYKSERIRFIVDTTPPSVELEVPTEVFSPAYENIQFRVKIMDEHSYVKINSLELCILTLQGKKVYTFSPKILTSDLPVVEMNLVWDGKDEIYNEIVPNGDYKIRCRVSDVAGNKTSREVPFKVYVEPKPPEKIVEKIVEKQEKLFYIKGAKVTLDERGVVVTYPTDELFLKGSDEINPKFYDSLSSLADIIKGSFANRKISIEGHTDSVGDNEENKKISSKYAWSVYSYLVRVLGVDSSKLEVRGWGEEKPIASNKSKLGRAKNRRLEIIIWNE